MKSLVAVLALAGLAAACSPGSPAPTAGGPTGSPAASTPSGVSPGAAVSCLPDASRTGQAVAIVDFDFQPAEVTISVGDVVTWTDTGSAPHTATLDDGPTCEGERMSPGGQHSVQFNAAGEYAYHCAIHGTMQAKVIVEP